MRGAVVPTHRGSPFAACGAVDSSASPKRPGLGFRICTFMHTCIHTYIQYINIYIYIYRDIMALPEALIPEKVCKKIMEKTQNLQQNVRTRSSQRRFACENMLVWQGSTKKVTCSKAWRTFGPSPTDSRAPLRPACGFGFGGRVQGCCAELAKKH